MLPAFLVTSVGFAASLSVIFCTETFLSYCFLFSLCLSLFLVDLFFCLRPLSCCFVGSLFSSLHAVFGVFCVLSSVFLFLHFSLRDLFVLRFRSFVWLFDVCIFICVLGALFHETL